jgi:pimeloyl-ACP methyl ester carboxylesterase
MAKNNPNKQNSTHIPKIIIKTAHFFEFISTKLATRFAAKLFTTPTKHKIPNREFEMDKNSVQSELNIPSINKKVVVYEYGKSAKKILLVHGWSGRGTQLFKIADELLKNDYATISFDAPAHGKSQGKNTIMVEFIESILEIDRKFGPFDSVIGHSLGGMALLNALNNGLKTNKIVTIGSGNVVLDIFVDFIDKFKMKPEQVELLRIYFEKKYNKKMNELSSYYNVQKIEIPVLVIHDENDDEIPISCAKEIEKNFNNKISGNKLLVTKHLGHRKILGDLGVINEILDFINKKSFNF